MKLTIIDNVISLGYQNLVEESFNSTNFDWYYQAAISAEGRDDVNTGFSHRIFGDNAASPYYQFTYPILLEAINKYKKGTIIKQLYRIRGAMFVKNQTSQPHLPHIDHQYKHYTMLYYVNDSDGPTRFFSNEEIVKEVEPKKGRVVLFNGDTYHASSSPRNHTRRMVINYNFLL